MSSAEEFYLALVIVSLVVFAGTLACTSWVERHWAKANGRG